MAFISFQPSDNYNTKLYTGTGVSNAVTGVGFQPDLTWIKSRDSTYSHNLTDAVRGATKYLESNATTTETTNAESLKSFDSDGFTVGTLVNVNSNTDKMVSWNWKAGTTTGIAGSPSITPTAYSFNATSGFSIITYTGTGSVATLPHGLGVAPDCIIVKKLSGTGNWLTYLNIWLMQNTKAMNVNSTSAGGTYATAWNSTTPTSTLFTLGSESDVNATGATYVAYCFANKKGFFHTGEYRGNGSATQPPCIFTGFRPGFVMFKACLLYTSDAADE